MNKLIIALLCMGFALFTAISSADGVGVDQARTAYLEAQNLFVNSMGTPEVTVSKHRNFMRYLARIQYDKNVLEQAKAGYDGALDKQLKEDPRFVDRDYAENPALQGALVEYDAIRNEVGESAFAEAEAAYADEFGQ